MHSELLQPDIQQYIIDGTGTDTAKLALHRNPFPHVAFTDILNQIAGRTKARDKLPTWFSAANILYPPKISLEQTSSETTAKYKASLVSGEKLIDLTGGFGVDDFYFSKHVAEVVHCELNDELQVIAQHNFEVLGATNIRSISGDSLEILRGSQQLYDWIYIDPSRRSDAKGKVFMLSDCLPNVPDLLPTYFKYADHILIKAAPILDLSSAIAELQSVYEIHIVAIENEVKELLFLLNKDAGDNLNIKTINFTKSNQQVFEFDNNSDVDATLGYPAKYLYEPNSAIMKSGGFDVVGFHFGLFKLHKHSHLYTSDELVSDFPGRVFEIRNRLPYNKNSMREFLQNTKANITTRNFPETVDVIRSKWKIKDGGDRYCFFTTNLSEEKIALICTKL